MPTVRLTVDTSKVARFLCPEVVQEVIDGIVTPDEVMAAAAALVELRLEYFEDSTCLLPPKSSTAD